MVHCDNSAVVDIWKKGTTNCPEVMALVRMLYFCAAQHNIHVLVTHVAGTDNSIVDALSRFQVHRFRQLAAGSSCQPRHHPCMADPALEGLLSYYQSLGVTQSTRRTYQAGVRALQQFCTQ